MEEGKVQACVTRSPSRDQELPLPDENWEDMSPKPFSQPSLCSRHFLELNLVLKESSCYSSQEPRRGSVQMTLIPGTHSVNAQTLLVQHFCSLTLILHVPVHLAAHAHLASFTKWKEAEQGAPLQSATPSVLFRMPHSGSQSPVPARSRKGGGTQAIRKLAG